MPRQDVAREKAQRGGVVLVSPCAEDHASLRKIFRGSPWKLQRAFTLNDGLGVLSRNRDDILVAICESSLPDGDWKLLMAELDKMPVPPTLIVSSRLADERLWAEVLNWGAFDLLPGTPFVAEEVLRVTESAWRAASAARERGTAPRMPPQLARGSGKPQKRTAASAH
jgi:hypothetical protein